MEKALIIVDVQHDFCPKGSLPVKDGDQIVPVINSVLPKFSIVATTQDWHPHNHISFSDKPGYTDKSWPSHCVQGTIGAQIHIGLLLKPGNIFVHKGQNKDEEQYSGFDGYVYNYYKQFQGKKYGPSDKLAVILDQKEVDTVYVCGLATDYCVKATALSALKEGFATFLILDACRGVNEETTRLAIEEMKVAGVEIITSKMILESQ